MNKLVMFICCMALTACGVVITPEDWAKFESVCKANGGIDLVTTRGGAPAEVHCNNTAMFSVSRMANSK